MRWTTLFHLIWLILGVLSKKCLDHKSGLHYMICCSTLWLNINMTCGICTLHLGVFAFRRFTYKQFISVANALGAPRISLRLPFSATMMLIKQLAGALQPCSLAGPAWFVFHSDCLSDNWVWWWMIGFARQAPARMDPCRGLSEVYSMHMYRFSGVATLAWSAPGRHWRINGSSDHLVNVLSNEALLDYSSVAWWITRLPTTSDLRTKRLFYDGYGTRTRYSESVASIRT